MKKHHKGQEEGTEGHSRRVGKKENERKRKR